MAERGSIRPGHRFQIHKLVAHANAAIEEQVTTDARTKAQTAYETAEKELAKLAPARLVDEIMRLIKKAAAEHRQPSAKLEAELARARQRVKLQAAIEKATEQLSSVHTPKIANSDAVALQAYLEGLGIATTADRINKLLVLLAVLAVECGGGLALAVGMSLSGSGGHVPNARTSTRTQASPDGRTLAPDTLPTASISWGFPRVHRYRTRACNPRPDTTDKNVAGVRFLVFLQERGWCPGVRPTGIGRDAGLVKELDARSPA